MKTLWLYLPLAWVLACCPVALAQGGQNSELDALREEIRSMRAEYEARIADLEARLDAAERAADGGAAKTSSSAAAIAGTMDYGSSANPSPQTVSVARDSAFNPAIGVTFQGQAWSYDRDPGGYVIPGFPLGGEAGPAPEGLSLAETEISISANVDDKFTAMLNAPIVIEDGDVHVELEEAWVETLGLPAGLAVRMGRFFSDIGYLNTRHFHAWDFADQPLVYQVFLGQQYLDDGLQLRWLAPTDFYLELGGEILRGDRYPGRRARLIPVSAARTLSARTGGDIGFSSSWLLGLSWLGADADERASGGEDDPLLFTGDSDLLIADFVWKWSPNGNSRQRNFTFQAEYLWRNEKGEYTVSDGTAGSWDVDQSGWYAQAVYQPFPRWRFGARYDRLSGDDPGRLVARHAALPAGRRSKPLQPDGRLVQQRVQPPALPVQLRQRRGQDDNQFGLQYIFSIGAHGAHSF